MDLGASITGIVVILACIIGFALMQVNNKKKEKKLLQNLIGFAQESNCQVTRHDLWEKALIGMDDVANKVFFIRKKEERESLKQVDLTQIQKCQLVHNSRTVGHKNDQRLVTDQVKLILTHRDNNKPETALEFYNVDYDSLILKGELQLAEKWCAIFNNAIADRII